MPAIGLLAEHKHDDLAKVNHGVCRYKETPIVSKISPLILSGGTGSRLWPLSRASYPKQFLPLHSDNPMLVDTAQRVATDAFASPTFVCSNDHRFLVAQSLAAAQITPSSIILEPIARNTAAAISVGALHLGKTAADTLVLVMPSDHVIGDLAAFMEAVQIASTAAQAGHLVTFGIKPTRPDTGYGYIQAGSALPAEPRVNLIATFVEKPNRTVAEALVSSNQHYWNAGIFLFRADVLIEEMQRYNPEVLKAARAALAHAATDLDFVRLSEAEFSAAPSIAFDHAVMEKTSRGAVIPVEMAWSDVGSWHSLWDVRDKDAAGNATQGDIWLHETANSLIHSAAGILTVAIGLEDIVIVATDDAILVADRSRAEDVKSIVDRISSAGRTEHLQATQIHRPWGSYRTLEGKYNYLVKRITVNPHASLSLQYHHHRAEHWVVVEGVAKVTRGKETFLLERNQSTYIPIGEVHRLENPADTPLHLIEVQSGPLITEDDIVRLDDRYGRESSAA
ncbi:MAG: mannose-1-phosphate guanylyltransferase/mannose-6-phosphate isomerase [Ferrovibrio sp.]